MSGLARAEVVAHAKVNLTLRVLGRREDGYHELETELALLEAGDLLVLEEDPTLASGEALLELDGPAASADVPVDERNLALAATRAALARVAELGGHPPGARLRLTKHLPSRAGLGGGSSDAAAALRAVEALCEVDLDPSWRRDWLAGVGSDTVFFDAAHRTGRGLCRGRGERVEALPALSAPWWFVVATPAAECPTGRIFGELAAPPLAASAPSPLLPTPGLDPAAERALRFNDLLSPALRAAPELATFASNLADLAGDDLPWLLSGSGSSFFCTTRDEARARALHAALAAQDARAGSSLRWLWWGPAARLR